MIQFFRKIRQNQIMENKTGKYFKYAIGEIVLVVIGILIALQINNWNENNNLNTLKQEYYHQLLVDLKKDVESIDEFFIFSQIDRDEYDAYIKRYNTEDLKPTQIYEALIKLNLLSTSISFNSSTIESLRSSGELILFPLEIRNKLLDLTVSQNKIISSAIINDGGKATIVQNLGTLRGGSSLDGRLKNNPQLKSFLKINENLPEIILGLDAIHKWKDHSELSSINGLKLLKKDIQEVIDLIASEMDKN